ncbi:hypothetical protein BJ138DRAFT_1091492 [Hygrophoropsis aurantiaca]|uniref:Uncharacterized protein n=1 Tax=Hygrophoropsis aurantiaca TaxID=72124 RepID=A0ACB8A516_9AGAM|nr:hypothetical protein BJ138DRAFT_1091492 [Hygrophoropsis aurantiaca]
MHFTLTSSAVRNTIFTNEDGQAVYIANTPGKMGSRVTTISKARPTEKKSSMRDEFESIAEIEWHFFSSSIFRMNGQEIRTKEFIPSSGLQGRKRTFTGPDGKSYKWVLNFSSVTLELADGSQTNLANFKRPGCFGVKSDAVLQISPAVYHMVDLIIITFIYIEKLRRDKENATRNAAIAAAVS